MESATKWRGWSTPIPFLSNAASIRRFFHNSLKRIRPNDSDHHHCLLHLRFRADWSQFPAVSMSTPQVFFPAKVRIIRLRLIWSLSWSLRRSRVFSNGLLRNCVASKRYSYFVFLWFLRLLNFGFVFVGSVTNYVCFLFSIKMNILPSILIDMKLNVVLNLYYGLQMWSCGQRLNLLWH